MGEYNVRTDLAIELVDEDLPVDITDGVSATEVVLSSLEASKIGKKAGTYITLSFDDITDFNHSKRVLEVFTREFRKLINLKGIGDDETCLVIGLGNSRSTPDSVGPLVLDKVLVTNHLYVYNELDDGFRRVYALLPGVMGETGIETSDLIKGVVDTVSPDFVVVVDALASMSISRVNKTIQMTDAGINPGSGVGNKRKEISFDTLGVPVIAIGVPTVVDAASIVSDTIHYMYKNYAYLKSNISNPASKLMVGVNYLKKDVSITDSDKKDLFGIVGTLSEEEVRNLIYEVLIPAGYNLMVTPKEEDFIVEKLSLVIGDGINKVLHRKVD